MSILRPVGNGKKEYGVDEEAYGGENQGGNRTDAIPPATVHRCGIGTGISEASKRVPIFPCATRKQESEILFSTVELGPSPRGSDRL